MAAGRQRAPKKVHTRALSQKMLVTNMIKNTFVFSFMVVNSILVAHSLLSISWLLAHTIFLLVLFDCK